MNKRVYISTDEDSSKPLLRGIFHGMSTIYHLYKLHNSPHWSYTISLSRLICCHGISSIYHIPQYTSAQLESLMYKMDRICILTLIFTTFIPSMYKLSLNKWFYTLLLTTISGIFIRLKYSLKHMLPFYVFNTCSIIPYISMIQKHLHIIDPRYSYHHIYSLICSCVVFLIYIFQYPNPFPSIFGYHEIFHLGSLLVCYFSNNWNYQISANRLTL